MRNTSFRRKRATRPIELIAKGEVVSDEIATQSGKSNQPAIHCRRLLPEEKSPRVPPDLVTTRDDVEGRARRQRVVRVREEDSIDGVDPGVRAPLLAITPVLRVIDREQRLVFQRAVHQ